MRTTTKRDDGHFASISMSSLSNDHFKIYHNLFPRERAREREEGPKPQHVPPLCRPLLLSLSFGLSIPFVIDMTC